MVNVPDMIAERAPRLPAERPHFWASFLNAWNHVDPPYGQAWYGDLFRTMSHDLDWLARLLIVNARKEADGSRQLWALAGRISRPDWKRKVRQHAVDESRHAKFYITMLELAFPDATDKEGFRALRKISPGFRTSDPLPADPKPAVFGLLDEIIQMNIGEVRTLINQMLMRPVLDVVAPDANRRKLLALIDELGEDELAHVAYTADLIEEMREDGDVEAIMIERMREFSDITRKEVGVGDERRTPEFA